MERYAKAGNRRLTRREAIAAGGQAFAALGLAHAAWAAPGAKETRAASEPGNWTSDSAALSRAFAPVFDERDDEALLVQGQIPRSLHGVFMRNGPNPIFKPDPHYAYPFDGTGMIHALYLKEGRASYRNRSVATRELLEEKRSGRRIYNSSFSAPPHANLANTNIVHHAGRYLALFEGGVPYEMTRDLKTLGAYDYGGKLPGRMSAHPKIDPSTGELLSVAYDLPAKTLTYLRMSPQGKVDRCLTFAAPWGAMVHDIAITAHHVIAFICPTVFDLSKAGPPATWQPERGSLAAVIPRDATSASAVLWIEGGPFFNFHVLNAYESGHRIEVVVPWYESFSFTGASKRLELHRLTLDTRKRTMQDETVDDRVCEFGRINDAHLGRRARFGYVGLRSPRPNEPAQIGAFEAFAKYDLESGAKTVHQFPSAQTVCEPVFVADAHARGEDDGFILSFVHDATIAGGLFVILDARDLGAPPLASIMLPRRVPAGLHGSWTAFAS